MATNIPGGFNISGGEQIDSRLTVTNQAAFEALENIGLRSYKGMLVFFTNDNSLHYVSQLNGTAAPTLLEYSAGSTSLSDLSLDVDLATFSVPANTTITSFGKTLLANTTEGQV